MRVVAPPPPAAWEGLGIGSVCKAPAFGPLRGWLVGGRRIRPGGEPSSCAPKEKGVGEWQEGGGGGGRVELGLQSSRRWRKLE